MKPKPKTTSFDKYVGRQIRFWRTIREVPQEELGEKLDVTFQQIQKYEAGINRVSTEKLCKTADFLNVPLQLFLPEKYKHLAGG